MLSGTRHAPDLPALANFATCAVVGSSAAVLGRSRGAEIDAHTAVIRFNDAPAKRFEEHVGRRTTLRVQNREWRARSATGRARAEGWRGRADAWLARRPCAGAASRRRRRCACCTR